MKVSRLLLAIIIMFAFTLPAYAMPSKEQQLFNLINLYRYQNKLQPLKENKELSSYAKSYCKVMSDKDFFNHDSISEGDLYKRATNFPKRWKTIGENLGMSYNSPIELMKAFKESPAHDFNLLREEYNTVGVGYYNHAGVSYWVVEFARY